VLATFSRDVPLGRVSKPEEIARPCSYLASDDSSYLIAAVIPLDGGAVAVDVSAAAIG
jgi:3-oxoacyl-[acyl-carrier protein] reductase